MKQIRLFFPIALLLFVVLAAVQITLAQQSTTVPHNTTVPAATSAEPAGQATSEPPVLVFLPISMNNYEPPPPPSSFDLIDAALQEGKIDAETALEYKTFANFGDERLPSAYQASEVGDEAGLFMLEVVEAYPLLSADAQAVLEPFFIPPYQNGSFVALSGHNTISAPSDWAYIDAVSGMARVWYLKANPELQRKAGVIAAALTSDIWPKETTLMGLTPVPDGAGVQNVVVFDHYRDGWTGTFLPLGDENAGMTVPKTCSETPSIIYINPNMPDTSGTRSHGKLGLIETTAHEFMHALQFSNPLAVNPCTEYNWLAEATANWAEDFVYPDHDSEWRDARNYLYNPGLEINDRSDGRDYGEYLLVYYVTHEYDYPEAVRDAWMAARYYDSLMSFMALGDMNFEQIVALWNREPFGTFFKDQDTLPYHIIPDEEGILKTAGFTEYTLGNNLLPGELHVYHYYIDPSVHTITILNGLTTKITPGPYNGSEDDIFYDQSEVSDEDMLGAEVVTLVKMDGLEEPWMLVNADRQDFCQDWRAQYVSEILVFMTNQEMSDRTRTVHSTGVPTKILVSSVPCMKLTGTATRTDKWSNIIETYSASGLEFVNFTYDPSAPPYYAFMQPEIGMHITKGSVSWKIQGTDQAGCSYSGSDTFALTEENNFSYLYLYYQLLPGSHQFLGYWGDSSLDSGDEATYTVRCPDQEPFQATDSLPFFMPDGTIPVKPNGALAGTMTLDLGGGGVATFEWNLIPGSQ
jgi:hypothetical protein